MDLRVLREFEAMVAREVPGFEVKFKDSSMWMKVIEFLVHPFNPKFSLYTTTVGKTVYFPSRARYEGDPTHSMRTLAHEFVHLYDGKTNKLFQVSYLFPQVVALVPVLGFALLAWMHLWLVPVFFAGYVLSAALSRRSLAAFGVALAGTVAAMAGLSIVFVGWPSLLLAVAMLGLIPWPAPWRTKWELRGYSMTMAMWYWTDVAGADLADVRQRLVEKFVGPDYFFMSWSRENIRVQFARTAVKLRDGALQEETPYRAVYDFLYQQGLLHR